jgi:DNA-binding response OmpR family regulator
VKILVMEDDKKLAGLVQKGLQARGFTVDYPRGVA